MKKSITLLFIFISISMTYGQKTKKTLREQLVGTWSLVSVDNIYPDSSKVQPYGVNPQGILTFDDKGNYAIQILKAVRPKVVSGDKNKCTPEENSALVQGSNSHFGKYEINENNLTLVFKIEHASFPNWEGTEQKRTYSYTGNDLKYVVTNTTQGGKSVIAEVAWRRVL
jgi:Lipocalin-like domain